MCFEMYYALESQNSPAELPALGLNVERIEDIDMKLVEKVIVEGDL